MTDGPVSAQAAGLHYVTRDSPGYVRRRAGKGFVYHDATGKRVHDATVLERIRKLVLPPAWTDVWISIDPRAHLQATGYDKAGRLQYHYHPEWRDVRDSTKYERMLAFAKALPLIRARVESDMRAPKQSRDRVLATLVQLLERTHARIGNEEYMRSNGSYGLTTLKNRHVAIDGRHLHFEFKAKSGVMQRIDVDDARLAKAVRECQELPGQFLFEYVDEEGGTRTVTSADVNAYLREVTNDDFTAKDFRTWSGTVTAAEALAATTRESSTRGLHRAIVSAIDEVAKTLGNTRAVCKKSYIHPAVLDCFYNGRTLSTLQVRRTVSGLRPSEIKLVALLESYKRHPPKLKDILTKSLKAQRRANVAGKRAVAA